MGKHHSNGHKIRLTVYCTEEEGMYIKMLATKHNMTISEYLLSFVRKEIAKKSPRHEPNEQTKKALKASREGEGEVFDSIEDFWKAVGRTPNDEN
jgi:hypothetical protein